MECSNDSMQARLERLQEVVASALAKETRGEKQTWSELQDAMGEVSDLLQKETSRSMMVQKRNKIVEMSAEVIDSNPYSRLMALQRMGIVENYQKIRECTIAVVGIGGVGSVAAEMLTRCGIGRLLLYDYDKVELANMNRLFFRPEHCGMTKTEAAAVTLKEINPDVEIEPFTMNITTLEGFDRFKQSLMDTQTGDSRVDLILSCVDNYEARMTINQICLELNQVWMESGVSEDAVSGHIQVVNPGQTACFACVPPLVVASGIDEKTLKREGVCAASLPTTMGIVAGMLVQNSLKYLLNFGQVTQYLGYSSLTDFFPTMEIKANPSCDNKECMHRQAEWNAGAEERELEEQRVLEAKRIQELEEESELHDSNEWGIEVVGACESDIGPSEPPASKASMELPTGIKYEHVLDARQDDPNDSQSAFENDGVALDELMAKLNDLSAL